MRGQVSELCPLGWRGGVDAISGTGCLCMKKLALLAIRAFGWTGSGSPMQRTVKIMFPQVKSLRQITESGPDLLNNLIIYHGIEVFVSFQFPRKSWFERVAQHFSAR